MKLWMGILFQLLLATHVEAQLTVKPSASGDAHFLYVNKGFLYIEDELNLFRNEVSQGLANLYLRNDAVLLQGGTGLSKNSGNGIVSIFQEGSSNAFDYDYWASPVGSPEMGNRFGVSMLQVPQNSLQSKPAQLTEAYDGLALPLTISSAWIYTYSGTDYAHWNHIGHRTEIAPGLGFTMKGVNGSDPQIVLGRQNNPGNAQRYDFRGYPNNGRYEVNMPAGDYVLVGNPYPSAFDLSLFLLEHSGAGRLTSDCHEEITRKNAITGVAYFWDSVEGGSSHNLVDYFGGYGVFSPVAPCTDGIYEPPIFAYHDSGKIADSIVTGQLMKLQTIPVGQGFMVESTSGEPLVFSNNYRRANGSYELAEGVTHTTRSYKLTKSASRRDISEKTGERTVIPHLRIGVIINEAYMRTLSLALWPGSTSGTDIGMDAKPMEIASTDVGWLQNGSSYSIDVRPFSITDEVPFFLKVEDSIARMKFHILGQENLPWKRFFLLDTEENVLHQLANSAVEIELPRGVYHDRFRLLFVPNPAGSTNRIIVDAQLLPTKQDLREVKIADQKPNYGKEFQTSLFSSIGDVDDTPQISLSFFNQLKQLEIINPQQEHLHEISLFDMHATLLKTWEINSRASHYYISLDEWSPAIYLLKLSSTNSQVIQKIVILDKN